MTGAPLLFAHRGGLAHAPENTLEAFRRGLELGADGLESDVWLTADGVPVLDHDGRVRRRWRRHRVRDLPRAALPAHIPALADLYDDCGTDFELALDVCDPRAVPVVIALAADRGPQALSRLWLCDPDPPRLASWRRLDARPWLVCSIGHWREQGATVEAAAHRLAGLGLDALNLPARRWEGEAVAAGHGAGLRLLGWGVDDERTARRLAGIGLDGIMGDDVPALRAALG